MSDEINIDLPADADDLSKHAPVLFSLQGKEEGFVVPALYFEELRELVISKTSFDSPSEWLGRTGAQDDVLPNGGLIVPENYFEESAEIIVANTILSPFGSAQDDNSTAGLTEPENYFEETAELIIAKTILPSGSGLTEPTNYFEELHAQLDAQLSLENTLPPLDSAQDDNRIPDGYFGEMERELHVHIALDNVKQDEGFVVPEGYFEKLTDRVIADFDSAQSDNNRFAQSDNDSATDDPNIPEGYFVHLADKVVARIENEAGEEQGKVIVLATWKKYVRPTALAASVALLIGFGWLLLGNRDNGNGNLMLAEYSAIVPDQVNPDNGSLITSVDTTNNTTVDVTPVAEPKKPNGIKPPVDNSVIMSDDEMVLAHSDLMDENMVMEFVAESNVIEESEEVLDADMMEYLMNENNGFEVFDPTEKK